MKSQSRLIYLLYTVLHWKALLQAWAHFDAGNCEGAATGVRVRLDNGVTGFIPIRNLSDKRVDKPEERVVVSGAASDSFTIFCLFRLY